MDPGTNPQRQTGQSGRTREPARIGSVLRSLEYYLKGNRQNLLAVQESLAALLPTELAGCVQVLGVHGGVVTLSVPDSAGKCLLETVLRGKTFESLCNALPEMSLRKAKVVLT
jgi:hypothetical protein